MKLPVPQEVLDALSSSSATMEEFGQKLDRVIDLLEALHKNSSKQVELLYDIRA